MKGRVPLFCVSREQLVSTHTFKDLFIGSQDCSFVSEKRKVL